MFDSKPVKVFRYIIIGRVYSDGEPPNIEESLYYLDTGGRFLKREYLTRKGEEKASLDNSAVYEYKVKIAPIVPLLKNKKMKKADRHLEKNKCHFGDRMKNFVKQFVNKFSILAVSVLIGTISSCASAGSVKTEDKADTEQNKPVVKENKQTENKSVENKVSSESNQTDIEVYDGRKDSKPAVVGKEDSEIVQNAVKSQEASIKQFAKNSDLECEIKPEVHTVAEGSFTAPKTSQKAYGYTMCITGTSDVLAGIMIAENGKPIANYLFSAPGGFEFKSLPDINKNGLSEFVIVTEDGGQGLRYNTVVILEYQNYQDGDLLKYLGWTQSGSVAFNSNSTNESTSRIVVKSAVKPEFFVETYEKKDGAKEWSLVKKSEKFELKIEQKGSTVFMKVK